MLVSFFWQNGNKVEACIAQHNLNETNINDECSHLTGFLFLIFLNMWVFMVYRSYYRCTNPWCNAKKQVERSSEDPQTLLVTYEGLHLHFAYPHFIPAESQPINPTIKKAKKTHETQQIQQELQESSADLTTPPDLQQQQLFLRTSLECPRERDPEGMVTQGLLEDVVMPFMIPNPLNNNTSPNYSSCSSYPSPPPSPPPFWSCAALSSTCFNIGIEH